MIYPNDSFKRVVKGLKNFIILLIDGLFDEVFSVPRWLRLNNIRYSKFDLFQKISLLRHGNPIAQNTENCLQVCCVHIILYFLAD